MATLGTLYVARATSSVPAAFTVVEVIQMCIVALLAVGAASLPRFTRAASEAPVIEQ